MDFPKERFPLQLIAYYVLYRIKIAVVYTGVSPKRFLKILLRGKELVDIFRARLIELVLVKLVLLQKK